MNRRDFDIDHIDPCWEEGRDYQLICGFKNSARNLREEDPSKNQAKANRFLPWRWCRDEIGVVPEEPGDLAYFLVGADIEKDIPGEWVLMEFLSKAWFKASVGTCSRSYRPVDVEKLQEGLKKWREENEEAVANQLKCAQEGSRKYREKNPEHFQNVKAKAKKWREENPEQLLKNVRKAISVRCVCTVTGKISRPGPLTRYQLKRGIDPSNRIRIQ